jgi:acylglycerol lipase
MRKILVRIGIAVGVLLAAVIIFGLVLAFLPKESKTKHTGTTPEQAAQLRKDFAGPHEQFTTTDGETLFLRRWNPDTLTPEKRDIAVLIFHGITAHSGPYDMAGIPFSAGGYTTFGLDYRGHGLSGGNRGDSPGKDRWIADLSESVMYVKSLGFTRVVILGHSLGVASAICAANDIPNEIAGVVLLSGAYEGKIPPTPIPFLEKARLLSNLVFRPSYQAAEYYREGMTVTDDQLFNFRYTVRFLTMLDVKTLRIPESLTAPVLVGAGDNDELFEVDKVRELYALIPGDNKEFLIMQNTTHAKIPVESWQQVVAWLDRTF